MDVSPQSPTPRRKPLSTSSAGGAPEVQVSDPSTPREIEPSEKAFQASTHTYQPVPKSSSPDHELATEAYVQRISANDKPAVQVHGESRGEVLRTDWMSRCLALSADVLLCLAVTTFLILAAVAIKLDGEELSGFGENIEQWAQISPTIFPLVFSALVGRSLMSIARHKLEHGSSLGLLEQLLGSQTVFGAISTQWVLRNFNLMGIALVLLWLISPLGGQATLRLLSHDRRIDIGTTTLAALNWTASSVFFSANLQQRARVSVSSVYTACLMAPSTTKDGPQDDWGNIKLPRFETYNHTLDSEGWADIPEDGVEWVSLLGLSIAGLNRLNDDSNFTFSAAYHDLECDDVFKTPSDSSWVEDNLPRTNATSVFYNAQRLTSWTLERPDSDTSDPDAPANKLDFIWLSKAGWKSASPGGFNWNDTCIARCSLSTTFVEAQVQCSGRDCRVARMKKIPSLNGFTESGIVLESTTVWMYFVSVLIDTDTSTADFTSSFTEN